MARKGVIADDSESCDLILEKEQVFSIELSMAYSYDNLLN